MYYNENIIVRYYIYKQLKLYKQFEKFKNLKCTMLTFIIYEYKIYSNT